MTLQWREARAKSLLPTAAADKWYQSAVTDLSRRQDFTCLRHARRVRNRLPIPVALTCVERLGWEGAREKTWGTFSACCNEECAMRFVLDCEESLLPEGRSAAIAYTREMLDAVYGAHVNVTCDDSLILSSLHFETVPDTDVERDGGSKRERHDADARDKEEASVPCGGGELERQRSECGAEEKDDCEGLPPPSSLRTLPTERLRRLFRLKMRIAEHRYIYREDETDAVPDDADQRAAKCNAGSLSSAVVSPVARIGDRTPTEAATDCATRTDIPGAMDQTSSKRKPAEDGERSDRTVGVEADASCKRVRRSDDTKSVGAGTQDRFGAQDDLSGGGSGERKQERETLVMASGARHDDVADTASQVIRGATDVRALLKLVVPAVKLSLFRELGCGDSWSVPTGWRRRSRVTNYEAPQLFVCLNDEHEVDEPTLPYGVVMEREIRTNEFGCEGATCSPGCLLCFIANGPDTFLGRPRARMMKWASDMLCLVYGITNVVPNPPRWLLTDYCSNGYALADYRRMGELGTYVTLLGPGEFFNAHLVVRKHYYRSAKTKAFLNAAISAPSAASESSSSSSSSSTTTSSPSSALPFLLASPRSSRNAATRSDAMLPPTSLATVVAGPPFVELSPLAKLSARTLVISGAKRTIVNTFPLL
jgi:hypothetical protein